MTIRERAKELASALGQMVYGDGQGAFWLDRDEAFHAVLAAFEAIRLEQIELDARVADAEADMRGDTAYSLGASDSAAQIATAIRAQKEKVDVVG